MTKKESGIAMFRNLPDAERIRRTEEFRTDVKNKALSYCASWDDLTTARRYVASQGAKWGLLINLSLSEYRNAVNAVNSI